MWPLVLDIIFVGAILCGVGFVAFENYGLAFLTIIALLAGAWAFFEPFKTFIVSVGWKTLLIKWLPIYLAVGVLVALVKWFFHVWKTAAAISEARETFKNTDAVVSSPLSRRQLFVTHYFNQFRNRYNPADYISATDVSAKRWAEEGIVAELLTPRAKNHLNRISFWVLEWPYVIVATIFDDILIKFARNVARIFDWAFTAASRFWISRVTKGI